jgi:ubiquinone/menaquinone biosynthesis C-methylase UbiE
MPYPATTAATSEVDSELFEQVSDEESALLDYYRALKPDQRAILLEMLVRMVEPERESLRSVGRP